MLVNYLYSDYWYCPCDKHHFLLQPMLSNDQRLPL